MRRRWQYGFTLVEMLAVIAVLAILAGLLFVGMRTLGRTGREKSTKVTLGNLSAMLSEAQNLKVSGLPAGAIPRASSAERVDAPGNVSAEGPAGAAGRHGDAVVQTQRALRRMATIPANKALFAKFPTNQLMALQWQAGVHYQPGDQVQVNNVHYQSKTMHEAQESSPPPGNSTDWQELTTAVTPQPIVLDAWSNPIIYVPGPSFSAGPPPALAWAESYGLRADVADQPGRRIVAPMGTEYPDPPSDWDNPAEVKRAKDLLRPFRAFWASAGADGDFSKGDDNVYSFEN